MIIWISLEVLIEMSQLPSSILDVLDLVLDPDRLNATDRTTRVIRYDIGQARLSLTRS